VKGGATVEGSQERAPQERCQTDTLVVEVGSSMTGEPGGNSLDFMAATARRR